MKKILAVILVMLTIVTICCSCGTKPYEEVILGEWYDESYGYTYTVFSFYDNGTCDCRYGGKWAIVNGNILRITDSWGDTENFDIISLNKDYLIVTDPYGKERKFYRDEDELKKTIEEKTK